MSQLRTTSERRQSLRLVTCTRCLGGGKIAPWCARCDDPTQDHECPPCVVCPRCEGARTLPNTKTILELLDDIETLIAENAELRAGTEEAAKRALFMLHIYGGHKVRSRGPVGCIHDILRIHAPALQKRLSDGEDPSAIYGSVWEEE